MSLLRPIFKQAIFHPRQTAIVDDRGKASYAKVLGGALHIAKLIEKSTDAKHIGVMLPTGGAFPVCVLACWLADRVPVPINYLLNRDDLHHVFADAKIDTLLTATPLIEHLVKNTAEDAIPGHIKQVALDQLKFGKIPPLRWPRNPADDELAVLLYTSGTSGKPKGVELTHRNLEANARACIEHVHLTNCNIFLGVLPQFHTFGLTVLTLCPLLLGARVIYTARFVPRRIVELMREHRPHIFVGVPSMYHALLSVKSAKPEDFASLKYAIAGGEKLPTALDEKYRTQFGLQLYEGYGLTETSPVCNWSVPDRHRKGSVGPTLPGVTNLILDENNRPLPEDAEGEIAIVGDHVMRGYHGLTELTGQVIVEVEHEGQNVRAFKTGDIGKRDADGFLFITGRKKEMLIVAGENVFPRQIEEVLDKHPHVLASAIVGAPDVARGEVPVAFVELCDDFDQSTFDANDVRTYCRTHLPPFMVPREINVIETLPRNPTGKILRRELKVAQPA
ncbi:MAG: AMP-binding protein [Planctomycetota bacterium]